MGTDRLTGLLGLSKVMGSRTPSVNLKRDRHVKITFPNHRDSVSEAGLESISPGCYSPG